MGAVWRGRTNALCGARTARGPHQHGTRQNFIFEFPLPQPEIWTLRVQGSIDMPSRPCRRPTMFELRMNATSSPAPRASDKSPPPYTFQHLAEWLADISLGRALVHEVYAGRIDRWTDDDTHGCVLLNAALGGMPPPRDPVLAIRVFLGEETPTCFSTTATIAMFAVLTARAAAVERAALTLTSARWALRRPLDAADRGDPRLHHVRIWCEAGAAAGADPRACRHAFDRAWQVAGVEAELGITTDVLPSANLRALAHLDRNRWETTANRQNTSVRSLQRLESQR